MIGPDCSDLIAEVATAMALETTIEALADVIHAHPTLAESVMEAAHVAMGQPINI
jgi:dihydrolipoamide dehydrogenase